MMATMLDQIRTEGDTDENGTPRFSWITSGRHGFTGTPNAPLVAALKCFKINLLCCVAASCIAAEYTNESARWSVLKAVYIICNKSSAALCERRDKWSKAGRGAIAKPNWGSLKLISLQLVK